jgi:hypothetical protein
MKETALAVAETGEKASNFKTFGEGDIVIGDRAYCGKQGTEYLLGRGSGFLFRFGTKRFHVYNRRGRKVNVSGCFKRLKPGESGEKMPRYEYGGGNKPLGFRAVRKTKEAGEKGLETLRKTRMRKHGNKTSGKAQTACNLYVIIITSITEVSPEFIPAETADRTGVQTVKALFRYREIPVHVERNARVWFYGKLLPAALCETRIDKGRFSPSEGRVSR